MADLTTIRLSVKASDIGTELADKFGFKDALPFFQFAMSYALSHHLKEIDFEKLDDEYDGAGKTYNVGSIRKSNLVTTALTHIVPNCKTPYRYIRVLMIYGTLKIKERLDQGVDFADIISVK